VARFHPDLRFAQFLPPVRFGPRSTALLNRWDRPYPPAADDLRIDMVQVAGPIGAPDIPVRLYRSRAARGVTPALLWIHGGGMISGTPRQDERTSIAFARTLGVSVVSVDYRLAPQHPAPAALEDCYAVLAWMVDRADDLEIDPARIAVGGASAGGGLAAGVTLMAHDRGEVDPAFQLLVYPMLDDRTVVRTDHDVPGVRVWTKDSNRYAWTSYLGADPGGPEVSPYAAPARRDDLSGLPPAWLGVGTLDLFHDEDLDYARRLRAAGVPCEVVTIPGAFHGFDAIAPRAEVSRRFLRAQIAALEGALFPR
jgi:acetyl esterase/lipase